MAAAALVSTATAYVLGIRVIMCPGAVTDQGLPSNTGEVLTCTLDDGGLGKTVLAALDKYASRIKHPASASEWRDLVRPLLNVAGFKSERALYSTAHSLKVLATQESVVVLPMIRVPRGLGYRGARRSSRSLLQTDRRRLARRFVRR